MAHFIALEEHFYSESMFNGLGSASQDMLKAVPDLVDQLRGVGQARLEAMDRGQISLQVVSHAFTPGGPCVEDCRNGNNQLADAIVKSEQPSRFAAFAVLPVSDPAACASELERTVSDLGFVGALIDNHANGKHYDSPQYDELWSKACVLDVPIYLHPTWPTDATVQAHAGTYHLSVAGSLAAAGWSWHSDVAVHVLKLFCAGVFDRFPNLKIIIGHMGEGLPFWLERCFDMSTRWDGWGKHERPLQDVWNENVWITTSGAWSLSPMRCLLENTKIDRIMYSVDYPFESNEKALAWFQELEKSDMLTTEQLAMIAHGNAERLLKLNARAAR